MRRGTSLLAVALISVACLVSVAYEPARRLGRTAIGATIASAQTAIWAIRYRAHDTHNAGATYPQSGALWS